MKILHVTQCYDGGVSRAINNISKLFPEGEHYILYSGSENPAQDGQYSAVKKFLGRNPLNRALQIRAFAKELGAEVIHAHSSWAGLYSRMLRLPVPVIYEPHCFVFDDPERHPLLRSAYRKIESLLSRRTTITVALSEHERTLATSLDENAVVHVLPNIPTIQLVTTREEPTLPAPTVTMIGRIAPQKDPEFFLELAQLSLHQGLPFKFAWIGAGPEDTTEALQNAGVEVTGWLSPTEISERLENTWIYFHSAQYEGFPLSVLDAAAAKVPIIVRDLPCFNETQLTKVDGLQEAISALTKALFDTDFFETTKRGGELLLQTMNEEAHTDVLRAVYSEARKETHFALLGS